MRNIIRRTFHRHLLCLIYPAAVMAGTWAGGWWTWASFVAGGSVYPLLDLVLSRRAQTSDVSFLRHNSAEPFDTGQKQGSGFALLVCFAIAEVAILIACLWLVSCRSYDLWELIGIALSLGTLTGGIGLPAAHELIHRSRRRERALGAGLLTLVFYSHFQIEHLHGHHVNVGTAADPATARFNEGLWSFLIRSIIGQFVSAYKIDQDLRRRSKRAARRANRVVSYGLVHAGLLAGVTVLFGWRAACVFLAQAMVAIVFLETINYIEHYGLVRKLDSSGRPEPVSARHSWNTSSILTNSFAFNLGYHADHHCHAGRRFTELRSVANAPCLPAGYLGLIAIAAVPPVWRRIMNPRVFGLAHMAHQPH